MKQLKHHIKIQTRNKATKTSYQNPKGNKSINQLRISKLLHKNEYDAFIDQTEGDIYLTGNFATGHAK